MVWINQFYFINLKIIHCVKLMKVCVVESSQDMTALIMETPIKSKLSSSLGAEKE